MEDKIKLSKISKNVPKNYKETFTNLSFILIDFFLELLKRIGIFQDFSPFPLLYISSGYHSSMTQIIETSRILTRLSLAQIESIRLKIGSSLGKVINNPNLSSIRVNLPERNLIRFGLFVNRFHHRVDLDLGPWF